jgi:hypothetical protein
MPLRLVHGSSSLSWILFFSFSSSALILFFSSSLYLNGFSFSSSACNLFSSGAVPPVGTTASQAATTVPVTESPPGVVENEGGEATVAESLGAACLLVVVAASSFTRVSSLAPA